MEVFGLGENRCPYFQRRVKNDVYLFLVACSF